jgi:hypothetical protein
MDEPTHLPKPAAKIGGVRHALPTRPIEPPYVSTPQTTVSAALEPTVNIEDLIIQNQRQQQQSLKNEEMSNRAASKANPSTYYPPSSGNQKHFNTQSPSQSVRAQGGIIQPGGHYNGK